MAAPAEDGLARIVRRLALVFALSVTIALPGGYFSLNFSKLIEHVETVAQVKAEAVSALATANPDLWIYELLRMEELLGRYPLSPASDRATVRDAAGNSLLTVGALPDAPVLVRVSPFYDSGRAVGQVEIAHSYREVVSGTFYAALLGLLLGVLVYATLLVLPLRALRRVTAALARQRDLYEMLSQTNQMIVRVTSRDELLPAVCRIAVEHGRFRFAWIGLTGKEDQRVKPVAKYGEDADYRDAMYISTDELDAAGRGPTGQAFRAGEHAVSNDFLNDPATAPWHEAARRAGVRAAAALPIRQGGAVIGTINLYAGQPGFFADDLLATLDEMAIDVSFALDNLERGTERKRMEETLRESEARFRSLTELSSDWYWEQDAELRLFFHSSGFAQRSGTTSSKLLGKRRWEEPNRFPLSGTWDQHRATLEAHEPFRDFEYVRIGDDGEQIFVSLSGVPIYDAAGNFNGYRGVGTNITERKHAEQALRAAEQQFRGLV
jgi:PAS domain S-box-containing protein